MAREEQSREAATIAADAYYGCLRLLDTLASETPGSFLAGNAVTMADCIAMAALQFAEKLYVRQAAERRCEVIFRASACRRSGSAQGLSADFAVASLAEAH